MMRRCCCLWFSSYYVSQLARVAIFPLHLDPPTKQHRHLFRALLGFRHGREHDDDEAMSLVSQSLGERRHCEDCECHDAQATHARARFGDCAARDGQPSPESRPQHSERGYAFSATPTHTSALHDCAESGEESDGGDHRQFWYMSSFEEGLRMDSQLAPFDDIILIPNTRYPVSLRRSTHLAALAVLGTRGLPNVHIDFTALEHPDETMSIIHEFTQHYRNCVLVHWLQDAYEMHDWRSFNQMKIDVPLLLLQTISLPPCQLAQRPPSRQVMQRMREQQHPTRLYHAPTDGNIRSESERHYYAQVRAHMDDMARQRLHGQSLVGGASTAATAAAVHNRSTSSRAKGLERERVCRAAAAPAAVPGDAASGRGDGEGSAGDVADAGAAGLPGACATADAANGGAEASSRGGGGRKRRRGSHGATESALADGGGGVDGVNGAGDAVPVVGDGGRTDATCLADLGNPVPTEAYADGTVYGYRSGSSCNTYNDTSESDLDSGRHERGGVASYDYDRDAPNLCTHDQHVKGEWWLTQGGRGDDSVEMSKMYSQSEGSSWLGAGDAESSPESTRFGSLGSAVYVDETTAVGAAAPSTAMQDRDIGGADTGSAPACTTQRRAVNTSQPTVRETAHSTGASSSSSSVLLNCAGTAGGSAAPADRTAQRARHGRRNVRELIQELYPSIGRRRPLRDRVCGAARSSCLRGAAGIGDRAADARRGGSARPTEHPASFVLVSAQHDEAAPQSWRNNHSEHRSDIHNSRSSSDAAGDGVDRRSPPGSTPPESAACESELDALAAHETNADMIPMVEVQPLTRCTGADVRHALWTRELDPSLILTDCVLRYIESHMLYRDSRKALSMRGSSGRRKTGDPSRLMHARGNNNNNNNNNNNLHSDGGSYNGYTGGGAAPGRDGMYERVWGAMGGDGYGDAAPLTGGRQVRSAVPASSHFALSSSSSSSLSSSSASSSVPFSAMPSSSLPTSSTSALFAASMGTMGSHSGAPYVHRPSLHRGGTSTMSYSGIIPRLELHYDRNNLVAREHYDTLRVFECLDGEEPDLIVPIGGDGYMLHCIRENWRRFIPFYGVNAGHVGYLLNDRSTLDELFSSPLKLHTTTMLYCQAERESDTGEHLLISELAFNDAWIERAGGQTALIRVLVNGEERIRRFYGDGVLVSTPAGSTAYSRALGASPLPVGSPLIQVVGSNVVQPAQWRPVHLDQEDEVVFEVMDTVKRPCHCYVDSVSVGNVTHLLVRSSRVASVSLVFSKSFDLHQKLYALQFPQTL